MSGPGLPSEAYLCALASLPDATPARLRSVAHLRPDLALELIAAGRWEQLRALARMLDRPFGRPTDDRQRAVTAVWQQAARDLDPASSWQAHRDDGVSVHGPASAPPCFAADPSPPAVIFARGDLDVLARPTAAIVGTRRPSRYGRDIAHALGRDLAEEGVVVVSGLAAGVDAAAHRGVGDAAAGSAPPVGIVGCGLDRPYPRANTTLWHEVAVRGLLCSEYPLGTPPAPWRFPARNRLIAAASDVVVVVESAARGGALITAREALARGRTVLSVPGSVHSPTSIGTNLLLSEGAHPCLGLDDVLCALGARSSEPDARLTAPPSDAEEQAVLDAMGWDPVTLDQMALRTGLAPTVLGVAVGRLVADGRVAERSGFYEQRAP